MLSYSPPRHTHTYTGTVHSRYKIILFNTMPSLKSTRWEEEEEEEYYNDDDNDDDDDKIY